eukprot:COSAG05_NODE_3680_length_1912_cov_1.478213_3_plen_174_part_00
MSAALRSAPATERELPTLPSTLRVAMTTRATTTRNAVADTNEFMQGLWFSRHQAARRPEEVAREEKLMRRVAQDVTRACVEVHGSRAWKVGTGHVMTAERVQQLASPRMPIGDPVYVAIEERRRQRVLSARSSERQRRERELRQQELKMWKETKAAEKAAKEKAERWPGDPPD